MRRPWTFALMALAFLAFNCATEPEPLDKTQPDALNKAMFEGEWHYKLTVVDTEWSNDATFIGEEAFFGNTKVRWEITEEKLNAYIVPQRYRDRDGNIVENVIGLEAMVLSFPIKGHFDIKYQENTTTREDLNVIVENDSDRPWWEREYIRVDFSESQVANMWAPMAMDLLMGDLVREPVSTWENVEFFDENEELVDTRAWRPGKDAEVVAMNIDTKESVRGAVNSWVDIYYGTAQPPVTVKWRHSLLKAKTTDYEPFDYRDDLFRRFGYFRTEFETYDVERATLESQKQYLINRWNLKGGKKIVFTLNPDFPTDDADLLEWTKEVVHAWNVALREATGRSDDIIELRMNEPRLDKDGYAIFNADGSQRWKYELGDMRYSFINYITRPQNASPLGYGPSYSDPDTGEIISVAVNVYGNWVDYVVTRSMDLYDLVAGNCSTEDVRLGYYFNEETGRCDAGVPDGAVRSQIDGEYVRPVVDAQGPSEERPAGNPLDFMSPALMSAYYPKSARQAPGLSRAEYRTRIDAARPQLLALQQAYSQHKEPLDLSAIEALRGTRFESMMVPSDALGGMVHGSHSHSGDDQELLAALSPASRLSSEALAEMKYEQYTQSLHCRLEPDHFDPAVVAFVEQNRDKPRDWVKRELRRWIYYNTTLHEMGHTLGLRHNFRGSVDRANFPPEYETSWVKYWDDMDALEARLGDQVRAGDAAAYTEYLEAARSLGNDRARYATSSIMDYTGDWDAWFMDEDGKGGLPAYDRAAILFGYGKKVEVLDGDPGDVDVMDDDPNSPTYGSWNISQWPWKVVDYQEGDFVDESRYDPKTLSAAPDGKDPRVVRYYMMASDEKVFDDAFCTRFDRGVTATEIVRNTIEAQYRSYFFRNFKRDSTAFDGRRGGYFVNKWLWTTYMMAKFLGQMSLNSMWYTGSDPATDFWGSIWDGIDGVLAGPEGRVMTPGYMRNGGEDLLRASMLTYNYLLYDVLMRPEYGSFQKSFDMDGRPIWSQVESGEVDPLDPQPTLNIPLGIGWGWGDRWDSQDNTSIYYDHLIQIGVELDKVIALEVMSIPAALNEPLWHEKANGVSFWNSLWNNNGSALWEVCRGLITEVHNHRQNPYCADAEGNLIVQPVGLLEGFLEMGIMDGVEGFQGETRCPEGAFPVTPGMDALFAIYPIFWTIAGSSHPWYHNAWSERLDAQVKGGNHRFDIPEGADVVEFTNPTGTKTWQAVQTDDNSSISYEMVRHAAEIMDRINFLEFCEENPADEEYEGGAGTHGRTCKEVMRGCFGNRRQFNEWCDEERWDSLLMLGAFKYREVERIEALLIMMQDMIDVAGHQAWRVPGVLEDL